MSFQRHVIATIATVSYWTAQASAQAPAVPAAPAAPTASQAMSAAQGFQPKNIWTFFCKTPEQREQCKQRFCNSAFGKLASNMLKPMTMFSGGVIPECCPPNKANPADLLKPADSTEGAAARIQKSEAEAKARRAAVRYLGTVDCHWFPEAEAALITGLRTDTNECVRFEAAIALGRGCCCTKKVIEALRISAEGSDKDKNPAENSERVKSAAMIALNRCLACKGDVQQQQQPEPPVKEQRPENPKAEITAMLGSYYEFVDREPMAQVVERARKTLDERVTPQPLTLVAPAPGQRNVAAVIQRASATIANPNPLVVDPAVFQTPVRVDSDPEIKPLGNGVPVSRPVRP